MPRYFLEVSYIGTKYQGFQIQQNANTIQAEIEKAMKVLLPVPAILTGSSRTDAGVHAKQNYFHFDSHASLTEWRGVSDSRQFLYKLNSILPADICANSIHEVHSEAHCRFDAVSREYQYRIYQNKDPFQYERAYYFPYKLDLESMEAASALLKEYSDFSAFSKRNTQVKTFDCIIYESRWCLEGRKLVYKVKGNRFLRGMVRALVATQLRVGRGKLSLADFRKIIESKDASAAFFSAPAKGLYLEAVNFPEGYFSRMNAQ